MVKRLDPSTWPYRTMKPRPAERASEALQEFITSETWTISRWVLERHTELLDSATDELLRDMVEDARARANQKQAQEYEQHRVLLRRCREVGMDTAFAEVAGIPIVGLSRQLQELIDHAARADQRFRSRSDVRELDAAVRLARRQLQATHADLAIASLQSRQAVLTAFGSLLLQRLLVRGDGGDLDTVLAAWDETVAQAPNGVSDLTSAFSGIGGVAHLMQFGRTDDVADLDHAIRAFEHAVAASSSPSERSGQLGNLERALTVRYRLTGDRRDLERAQQAAQRR